jgi:hypothetical protein
VIDSPEARIRWFSCRNAGTETIPGYALLKLAGQTAIDGQIVWNVEQPDAMSERLQNPALLAVNGPTPILCDEIGRCTQDWPAQVLYDTSGGFPSVGTLVGPEAGSWYPSNSGFAFSIVALDSSQAYWQPSQNRAVHWIAPRTGLITHGARAVLGASVVDSGDVIPINSLLANAGEGISDSSDGGLEVSHAGFYLFGFSATLSSTAAPRGSELRMQLHVDGVSTNFLGFRGNDIEEDSYGNPIHYTEENVAVTGLVPLNAGSIVTIKNTGYYQMTVAAFVFWLSKLGTTLASSPAANQSMDLA